MRVQSKKFIGGYQFINDVRITVQKYYLGDRY